MENVKTCAALNPVNRKPVFLEEAILSDDIDLDMVEQVSPATEKCQLSSPLSNKSINCRPQSHTIVITSESEDNPWSCSSSADLNTDFVILEEISCDNNLENSVAGRCGISINNFEKKKNKDNTQVESRNLLNDDSSSHSQQGSEKSDCQDDSLSDSQEEGDATLTSSAKSNTDIQIEECLRALQQEEPLDFSENQLSDPRHRLTPDETAAFNLPDVTEEFNGAAEEAACSNNAKLSSSHAQDLNYSFNLAEQILPDSQPPAKRYMKKYLYSKTSSESGNLPGNSNQQQSLELPTTTSIPSPGCVSTFTAGTPYRQTVVGKHTIRHKQQSLPVRMSHSQLPFQQSNNGYRHPFPLPPSQNQFDYPSSYYYNSTHYQQQQQQQQLYNHIPSHCKFRCIICNVGLINESDVIVHNNYYHRYGQQQPQQQRTDLEQGHNSYNNFPQSNSTSNYPDSYSWPESRYECRHCKIFYHHKSLHTLHMRFHHPSNPLLCAKCGTLHNNVTEFYLHLHSQPHPLDL